ncbi:flagellar hook assembly protein FlgD [Denitratisoma sp. agr-D3]
MATSTVSNSNNNSAFDYTSLNGTSKTTTSTEESQTRFLKLLTTQLQNQDPLNPMDNAQMTSQMAQLNMVDGINKMNTSMQSLLTSMTSAQTMQATSMVNHGVLVPGSGLTVTGKTDTAAGTAVGGYKLASGADTVKITIKDSEGNVVKTNTITSVKEGVNAFTWDGLNEAGEMVANGNYTFSVEAAQGGNKVDATALTLGVISSVTNGTDGLTVNVSGRGSYKLSEIEQVF